MKKMWMMRKKILANKFKFWVKLVILCERLCNKSKDNLAKSRDHYESVLQIIDDYKSQLSWEGNTFTPEYFKARNKDVLSPAVKNILRLEPGSRRKEDIEKMLIALRNIPAFAEYPMQMQRELCKAGRFESYEEKRVVVLEGHIAHCFYIILSGTVIVTVFDESTGSSNTLVTLDRGMSFGELGIITDSKRQASVCCKTDVELLSITYLEFKEIFMAGGMAEICEDDQCSFIRSLCFLRYWPTEKLKENPSACGIYYFHRSTVLVRDSNNSDWIYVVLKGSLSVLKKLKKCKPDCDNGKPCSKNTGTRKVKNDDKLATFSTQICGTRLRRTGRWQNVTENYPDMPEKRFKSTLELESKLNQTLPGYINTKDRLLSLDYDKIIKSYQSKLLVKSPQNNDWLKHRKEQVLYQPMRYVHETDAAYVRNGLQKLDNDTCLPNIDINNKVVNSEIPVGNSVPQSSIEYEGRKQHSTDSKDGEICTLSSGDGEKCTLSTGDGEKCTLSTGDDNDLPQNKLSENNLEDKKNIKKMVMIKSLKGAYLAASRTTRHEVSVELKVTESTSFTEDESVSYEENEELSVGQKIAKLQMSYQMAMLGREGRKTIAEDLDQKGRRDYKVTEADLDPVFIQVQVLERGQYFGVVQLVSFDEPSLSVISNGAECLVISKKLFKTWASDKCWRHLRQTEFSYPSDEELARKLKEVLEWQQTSATIYQDIQSGIQMRKSKQKQFLPAYIGQYCFRTGPV